MSDLRHGTANSRSDHYSGFSRAEIAHRQARVRDRMREEAIDALLVYDHGGFHQGTCGYLTNYAPPYPTYVALFTDPNQPTTIFVGVSNHLQYVRERTVAPDLRLLLPDPPRTIVDRFEEASGIDRIGLVSADPRYNFGLPHPHYERLTTDLDAELVEFTDAIIELASRTTEAERERMVLASSALDSAMEALEGAIEPGITEAELAGVLASACSDAGANLDLAFLSSAPMTDAEPGAPLPWKLPSDRSIAAGDVVTTEISASVDGYATQIHRPYAVGAAPSSTYTELYEVASVTLDRLRDHIGPGATATDLEPAMEPIEGSRFKLYDVLVHGYGSAYRHPFIGVPTSNYWPGADDPLTADWTFEPGQVIVLQPNVATPDERAALQFGTTVRIEDDGIRDLHHYPETFHSV